MKLEAIIKDAEKLLGNEKELHIFKGLLMNPEKAVKEGGEYYYGITLKCLKNYGDDAEYGQSYNMYHMIIPSDIAKDIPASELQSYKNNEVIVIASTKASVKKKENVYFNNVNFYVTEIKLSRVVGVGQKPELRKVENL